MGGTRECHTEWDILETEKQISYINAYKWNLKKNIYIDDLIYKAEKETQTREQAYGYQGEEGLQWTGRLGLTYVHDWYNIVERAMEPHSSTFAWIQCW